MDRSRSISIGFVKVIVCVKCHRNIFKTVTLPTYLVLKPQLSEDICMGAIRPIRMKFVIIQKLKEILKLEIIINLKLCFDLMF